MCIIIDACVCDVVFATPPSQDALPVVKWIEEEGGRVVLGGTKLTDELTRIEKARRQLLTWWRAGRLLLVPNDRVDVEQRNIAAVGAASSNDTHVLALARVSGARILYSFDTGLHSDFKNPALIDQPRGVIYQSSQHAHLLGHHAGCR